MKNESKFLFMATVLTTDITVDSLEVVEELGSLIYNPIQMQRLHKGTSGAVYASSSYPLLERCHTYYFMLNYTTKNGTKEHERYPEQGYFYTYGMSCNTDWDENKITTQCNSGFCCDIENRLFKPSSVLCRNESGPCDPEDYCTGMNKDCPENAVSPQGTICNRSSGSGNLRCQDNAVCDGISAECPDFGFKPNGTRCRDFTTGGCEIHAFCNGSSYVCPQNPLLPAGTVCRNATGECEEPAVCNGKSNKCPEVKIKSEGTVCRPAVGPCDVEEVCDGVSAACPPEKYKPAGSPCNCSNGASTTECSESSTCTGKSRYCGSYSGSDSSVNPSGNPSEVPVGDSAKHTAIPSCMAVVLALVSMVVMLALM